MPVFHTPLPRFMQQGCRSTRQKHLASTSSLSPSLPDALYPGHVAVTGCGLPGLPSPLQAARLGRPRALERDI